MARRQRVQLVPGRDPGAQRRLATGLEGARALGYPRAARGPRLERDVAVLSARAVVTLVGEQLETLVEAAAHVTGLDDLVDEAELGSFERAREPGAVLGDQLLAARVRVGRGGDGLAV